ncbi:MAG: putative toxin-antitoxin system toxin component, PIN family [Burkholderiaceae bacterium]
MRLVLDTNVIVAAFRSRNGASNQLLRLVDQGAVTPLCSTALFLEYEAVLSREEIRKATNHTLKDVEAVMSALAAASEGVDISFRTRPMLADAADEMVLEAALNGQAEAIVTHNVKDFRPALELGVAITTPAEIVRRLNA